MLFSLRVQERDLLMPRNLEKYKAYQKAYRQAHQARLKQQNGDYYNANRATILQQQHDTYWSNRDERVAQRRNDPEREAKLAQRRAQRDANKDAANAQQAAWRQANPEKVTAQQQRANAKGRAKRLEARAARPGPTPEEIQAKVAAQRARKLATKLRSERKRQARLKQDPAWREQQRQRSHAYREAHPDLCYQRVRDWMARHPEQAQALDVVSKSRRRAHVLAAPLNDLTPAQWQEIKAAYDHRCVYCGRSMARLTMDHITPLSKGGSHTRQNVVPACKTCNSKKKDRAVLAPVQPVLLTVAPAKKKRRAS